MQPFSNQPSANFSPYQGFLVPPQPQAWPRLVGWAEPTSNSIASAINAPVAPEGQGNGLRLPTQNCRKRTETEMPQQIPEPFSASQIFRPKKTQDWLGYQARITELYWEQKRTLSDVMKIMRQEHPFDATERQYKGAFKRWKIEKNNKTLEAEAMIRIQQRRQEQEGKSTVFFLRKRKVPSSKIERFASSKKRKLSNGGALPVSAPTPEDLTYHTPPSDQTFEVAEAAATPASSSLVLRTPAASPARQRVSTDIQSPEFPIATAQTPTMDFLAAVVRSPPNLVQPLVRPRPPCGAPASEQLPDEPSRLHNYIDVELSDELDHSHLSDPLTAVQHHGSGYDSVFSVTPGKSVGSGEHVRSSQVTGLEAPNSESSANLTTEATIQQPLNTTTQTSGVSSRSRYTFEKASTADPEAIDLAATPKAVYNEPDATMVTTDGRTTPRPGTHSSLIAHNGPSQDGMDVGGFTTVASPAPSRTNSDVYITPMSYAADSPATDSESDDYVTPMGFTTASSPTTPSPDAEHSGASMDLIIANTLGISERGAYLDENATSKNTTTDHLSISLYKTSKSWHLMHLASGIGDESSLQDLLRSASKGQHLARIKLPTKREETALHVAARAGHLGAVRLLAKADRPATRIVDSNMDTPLHVAVKSAHLDFAQELFHLGGAVYQLTYKRAEFSTPHHDSPVVSSSSLAKSLLELLFCGGMYLRDHGPRKDHASFTSYVKNRSAAIWILASKYDDGALEAVWLRLVALSLKKQDEALFIWLLEILPDVEAGRRGLDEELLSCFRPIYGVSGDSGRKKVMWEGVRGFMKKNVNLFSLVL